MYVAGAAGYGGLVPLIGLVGLGIAWFQWYNSDTVGAEGDARAGGRPRSRRRSCTAMIDRLCALADMPKPRVASPTPTCPTPSRPGGRPSTPSVCVTTGILRPARPPEELEAVLAHELSHVAHRDVLVMTLASSAGIIAGMATRGAQYGMIFGGGRRNNNNNGGAAGLADRPGDQPRRLRGQLLPHPDALPLPGAVRRPVRRLPHPEPSALASRADQDQRGHRRDPQRDLREVAADERLLHRARGQRRHAAAR